MLSSAESQWIGTTITPECAGCQEPIRGAQVVLEPEHGGGVWHPGCRPVLALHADPAVAVHDPEQFA
jgi:hypothetical protein